MADDDRYEITGKDRKMLVDLIQQVMDRRVNPYNLPEHAEADIQAPEVYAALTPSAGIPALTGSIGTGTGSGYGDMPGSATCWLFRVDNVTGDMTPLHYSRVIYNLYATAIPGSNWVTVKRDKWGTWWVDAQQSSGGSGSPGGFDTYVQYNQSGSFGGDFNFKWNYGGQILTLLGKDASANGNQATEKVSNSVTSGGHTMVITVGMGYNFSASESYAMFGSINYDSSSIVKVAYLGLQHSGLYYAAYFGTSVTIGSGTRVAVCDGTNALSITGTVVVASGGSITSPQLLTTSGGLLQAGATFYADANAGKIAAFGVTPVSQRSGDVATGLVALGFFSVATYAGTSNIVASADLTGQSGAVASVAAYTAPAANGSYRVGGYVTITAVAVDVLNLQLTWTDETNTARTQTFFPQGVTSASLATTGTFVFPTMDIRVKASATITVLTTLAVGGGTITYDVGCTIEQLR